MIPFPSKSANFSPVRTFSRARRHRDRAVSPILSYDACIYVLYKPRYKDIKLEQ
jgi:hypothetical protein